MNKNLKYYFPFKIDESDYVTFDTHDLGIINIAKIVKSKLIIDTGIKLISSIETEYSDIEESLINIECNIKNIYNFFTEAEIYRSKMTNYIVGYITSDSKSVNFDEFIRLEVIIKKVYIFKSTGNYDVLNIDYNLSEFTDIMSMIRDSKINKLGI